MRLLTKADVPALRRLLEHDPDYTLFMLGDLVAMGVDHPNLAFWGEQARGGEFVGVAMRYKRYWQFYERGGADLGLMARLIDQYPGDTMISGRTDLVRAVLARSQETEVTRDRDCVLCAMPLDTVLPEPRHPTRRATTHDVGALMRHFGMADTMRRDAASIREALVQTRIYVALAEERIVSTALTNVETETRAMIGGVYTPMLERGQGYGTAAIAALCRSLLADGLKPCLFWDNPVAGRIYQRLGFIELGGWTMVSLQHQ